MSNPPQRPVVDPNEFERNRKMIASYRTYLDMYEHMNEEGLRNHEEVERAELILQEQVRQGEEARRQLLLLRQSGGQRMRITDGLSVNSNTNVFISSAPPVIVPNVQTTSTSAYIEEVQDNRVTNNASNANYAPSSSYQTHAPQPSYHHRPPQQKRPPVSQYGATYSQPIQQNVSTVTYPPQQVAQSAYTVQPPQTNVPPPQQSHQQKDYYPNVRRQVQPQQARNIRPTTATQIEQRQQTQTLNQPSRQAIAQQIAATPTHYYSDVGAWNTPSSNWTPYHLSAWQKAQQTQTVPVNGGQTHARKVEVLSTVPAPSGTTSANVASTFTSAVNATGTTSSLDGALGSNQSTYGVAPASKPSPLVLANSSTPQVAPTTAPPLITSNDVDATVASSSKITSPKPAAPKSLPLPTSTSSIPPPSTPTSLTVHKPSVLSPRRTPKDADKRFLARDLLRALKRPRPEASSSMSEPDPKRHAPNPTARSTERPQQPIPTIPTPLPTTTTQTIIPIPATPTPPLLAKPPIPASASVPPLSATPTDSQRAAPRFVPPSTSTDAAAQNATPSVSTPIQVPATTNNTLESLSALLQKYPHLSKALLNSSVPSLSDQTRARINQVTSFGPHSTNTTSTPSSAGTTAAKPSESNPPQKSAPVAKNPVTDPPVSRVPLQSLQFRPIQTPNQPLFTAQPSGTNQVKPQPSTPAAVVAPVPVPVVTPAPIPSASLKAPPASANIPSVGESQSATIVEVPTFTVLDNEAGPSTHSSSAQAVLPTPKKLPLFFPSPTLSPQPSGSSIPAEVSQVSSGRPSGPKFVFDCVLIPPMPEKVKAWKRQMKDSHGLAAKSVSTPSSKDDWGVSSSRSPSLGDFNLPPRSQSPESDFPGVDLTSQMEAEESDIDEESYLWDLHFASYDDAEKEVLNENSRILRVTFCRWLGCEAVLNASGALLRHLTVAHGPKRIDPESPWTCRWVGCGHTFISRDDYRQHIERHSVFPLWCPYLDCHENFRTPRQLIKHKSSDHSNNTTLRPTAEPSTVTASSEPSMEQVPKTIPSYVYEYRNVRPAPITRQRHEMIMPSILRRISGNVPTQLQSYNAARPMPTPSRSQESENPPPPNTPYSFLLNRSTRYSSYLSSPAKSRNFIDLASSNITELVRRGMVLWPEAEGAAIPEEMLKELGELEVEGELLDEQLEEGHDVFGPTIAIEAPAGPVSSGGDDGSGFGS